MLRKAIVHCAKVGDFTTRQKLEEMVVDSEEHVDYFERQLADDRPGWAGRVSRRADQVIANKSEAGGLRRTEGPRP